MASSAKSSHFFGFPKFRRQRSNSIEPDEKADEKEVDLMISRRLIQAQQEESRAITLIMLGAGGSGKSTLLKQMKYLYSDGRSFREEYHTETRLIVFRNIIEIIVTLLKLAKRKFGFLPSLANSFYNDFRRFNPKFDDVDMTPNLASDILAISEDAHIRSIYDTRLRLPLMDNAEYFVENLGRLLSTDYTPIFDDYIHCNQHTVGKLEESFMYKSPNKADVEHYRIVDVGGQRNERPKWIHFFDDVFALIYVLALSGYDQTLFENAKRNRMIESLDLFDMVLRQPCFQNKNIILFMNKQDLFEKKIAVIPFNEKGDFPDFRGNPHDSGQVIQYLEGKFSSCNRNPKRTIYFHIITAIDTEFVDMVFGLVHDTVVRNTLRNAGLL